MTMLAFGAAAVALLIVAMLPRVGRRREEVAVTTATGASSATGRSRAGGEHDGAQRAAR